MKRILSVMAAPRVSPRGSSSALLAAIRSLAYVLPYLGVLTIFLAFPVGLMVSKILDWQTALFIAVLNLSALVFIMIENQNAEKSIIQA
ncbi:hypothetical protein [Deinococcus alpinitundrae]|uniref:hypothetical protein n=1 Tax=Deinococcus alpinitundrae TaxID=468913 RepID=UPI00137AECFF|nr:hypothetical protein [Deinococcus alpinitundrae]